MEKEGYVWKRYMDRGMCGEGRCMERVCGEGGVWKRYMKRGVFGEGRCMERV